MLYVCIPDGGLSQRDCGIDTAFHGVTQHERWSDRNDVDWSGKGGNVLHKYFVKAARTG